MKRLGLLATVLGAVLTAANPAAAGIIWYNGDFDGQSGLANEQNTIVSDARTYDDFALASPTTISAVFSNNLMSFTGVTQASWEIRSGVSVGDGGTIVSSGLSSATQTATGRSGFGLNEYTIRVGGLNVPLGSGTYWLMVAPIGNGDGRSFLSTTSGLNAIGPPGNDGNSFFDSPFFISNFSGADSWVGIPQADFSLGVESVPEPGTMLLLGAGLTGLAARRRRRHSA